MSLLPTVVVTGYSYRISCVLLFLDTCVLQSLRLQTDCDDLCFYNVSFLLLLDREQENGIFYTKLASLLFQHQPDSYNSDDEHVILS